MSRHKDKDSRLRQLIAQQAARIILESGKRDFYSAKHKAANRLNISDTHSLPSNNEIEQALIEHQRIFQQDTQAALIFELRQTAVNAMALFSHFEPRLVGTVLKGTADKNSSIHLHVFTDTAEELDIFLLQNHIPFENSERCLRYATDLMKSHLVYQFIAGEFQIELTVFNTQGIRQSPLSPIDGKPMERATLSTLRALLDT